MRIYIHRILTDWKIGIIIIIIANTYITQFSKSFTWITFFTLHSFYQGAHSEVQLDFLDNWLVNDRERHALNHHSIPGEWNRVKGTFSKRQSVWLDDRAVNRSTKCQKWKEIRGAPA